MKGGKSVEPLSSSAIHKEKLTRKKLTNADKAGTWFVLSVIVSFRKRSFAANRNAKRDQNRHNFHKVLILFLSLFPSRSLFPLSFIFYLLPWLNKCFIWIKEANAN
ncbi:hypothetical protein X777_05027 [Ooceraea biroi]|uniref:Uncharacterized protein n=1 Tax=Ooceraea biroi TaxID=2015173 RepID=A0A026WFA8_OOCBI|nr:hypothetical protein X777_05027 [Ooceraea biroi]